MDALMFFRGILIGFAMAIPIGPIGILCIRKTLSEGRLRGFIIGLGAATADMLYGCVAAFGLTIISNMIEVHRYGIRLAGGILLIGLGIRVLNSHVLNPKFTNQSGGLFKLYMYTIILTLTNPFTIFAFIAIFALLGLASINGIINASLLVAGVFTGSGLWFFLLSYGASFFRNKINSNGLRWVNRIAGSLIIVSGIIALASLF